MTTSLIWFGFVSFALSVILTPIFRDIFRSYNVVDQPDQGRKIHKHPIPRVGGMAIASAYVACFFLVPLFTHSPYEAQLSLVWDLLPGAGVIFATGVIDDLFGLKPWQKLLGQLAGALLAYWGGVRIADVVGFSTQNWLELAGHHHVATHLYQRVQSGGRHGRLGGRRGNVLHVNDFRRGPDAWKHAAGACHHPARRVPAGLSLL